MVFDPDFLYIESGFVKRMKPALGGAAAPNGDEGSYGEARETRTKLLVLLKKQFFFHDWYLLIWLLVANLMVE